MSEAILSPDIKVLPELFSSKVSAVSDHCVNIWFLNQFDLHQSFFAGHRDANYSAWILYALIYNKEQYSLKKEVYASNLWNNSFHFIVPKWNHPVGDENFSAGNILQPIISRFLFALR